MKKFFSLLLVICLVFSLSSCGNDNSQKELVDDAIKELKSTWENIYDNSKIKTDGYFAIKNTRVISIKENNTEEFENIDYIVEFVLYTDYSGSAPYYKNVGIYDTVVVYKDGTMEVQRNLINLYRSKYFSNDFSDFIKSIDDYGDKYNCIEDLK